MRHLRRNQNDPFSNIERSSSVDRAKSASSMASTCEAKARSSTMAAASKLMRNER